MVYNMDIVTHSPPVSMADDPLKMPNIDMKDVDVGNAWQQFLGIIKLDKKVIESVAGNKKSDTVAGIFLLIGVVAVPLAHAVFGMNVFGGLVRIGFTAMLTSMLGMLISVVLSLLVATFVAVRLFHGKGSFVQLYRVLGLAYALNVLNVLGVLLAGLGVFVSLIVMVWMLLIIFHALKYVFHLDDTNAVLTIVITVVSFLLLGQILLSLGFPMGSSYLMTVDFNRISITY